MINKRGRLPQNEREVEGMSRFVKIASTIGLIAALAFISVPNAEAGYRGGLNVTIYDTSGIGVEISAYEPWISGPIGSRCAQFRATIDQDFSPEYGRCSLDDFLVHYSGYLKVPRTGIYTFYARIDDGFHLQLGGDVVLYDWEYQGGFYYNVQGDIELRGRRAYELQAWMFEGGGGQEAHLYYSVRGSEPQLVPASWFSPRR